MTQLSIFVSSQATYYSDLDDTLPGYSQLKADLKARADIQNIPVTDEIDLLLDSDGLVQGRYRLTTGALRDLCSLVCNGFYAAIRTLAEGLPKHKWRPMMPPAPGCAIEIVNAIIRELLPSVRGRMQMFIDRRSRTVEGFSGTRFRMLSSFDLLSDMEELVHRVDPTAKFLSAILHGGRFSLRFAKRDPLFSIFHLDGTNEKVYGGWYVLHRESRPRSICGAAFLFRPSSGTTFLQTYTEASKAKWVGTDKSGVLKRVFRRVNQCVGELRNLETVVNRAVLAPIGFGSLTNDESERKRSRLIAYLRRLGLQHCEASKAVSLMIARRNWSEGLSSATPANQDIGSRERLQLMGDERTLFELSDSISRLARRLSPLSQERAEQAAYQLLSDQSVQKRVMDG